MLKILFLLLRKANAYIFYLDKKHVQLYFATQFGHLNAKFAPENAKKKPLILTIFVNFRYFDISSLMTSQLQHTWSVGTLFGMIG